MLVGRRLAIGTLRSAVDAALAGAGGVVLLAGEAGMGKTALASEAVAYAKEVASEMLTVSPTGGSACGPGARPPEAATSYTFSNSMPRSVQHLTIWMRSRLAPTASFAA
jgi:AAA ATPase domain